MEELPALISATAYDHSLGIGAELALESVSAVSIIHALLVEAHAVHASDLHLDPGRTALIARLRVDGTLKDVHTIPNRLHSEILARLKILAGLRTDEHREPQDGRFRFELPSGQTIDIRIAIAPTYYGENAVLRLLSSSNSLVTLASLGFNTTHQATLQKALKRPHGMILITGPTGSGKTSTLYALIRLLNVRDISIITIEDPIEYALDGINQIPASTNDGLSFARGLRSMLRQDPNIIGIGEIRDTETAALATNAALTGHLVLSTLHTTSAPTAIPRLIDMGVEPYLVASTVSIVISQRLLRKLCTVCRVKRPLRAEQRRLLSGLSGFALAQGHAQSPSLPPYTSLAITSHYESKGCVACGGTGISGRIGVFEVMSMGVALRDATIRKPSAKDVQTLAISHGMVPLFHDGIQKAMQGVVSLDDVLALITE